LLNVRYLAKLLTTYWLFLIIILNGNTVIAGLVSKNSFYAHDTLKIVRDTLSGSDLLFADSSHLNATDSSKTVKAKKHTAIDSKVTRQARDSIVQNLKTKKVFLYGDAVITYGDITLKAAYIEVDFNTNTVYATGLPDSTGKIIGKPEFTEGNETFKAKTIRYNFDTKKGIIRNVNTKDNQGILHGKKVKKEPDNSVNIKGGYYTTCDKPDHPDYEFRFSKARVIPNKKIVTGPAYLVIEGVPTPIAIPFGFFPNNPKKQSGLVIPTYGESPTRGFYLEGGGYYWHINDYLDLKVIGDIYTHGSWKVSPTLRYRKRYKYIGSFSMGYARNIIGVKGEPDYSNSRDFSVRWTHRQDPKSRPHSNFSANVNIVSSNFIKYNTVSVNEYLRNEFQSSVAYQTNWAGKYYLTVNASQRQNTQNHKVQITLPELTFTVNRFYPLRSKKGGKKKFYEDLSVSYTMNTKNTITGFDSTFFKPRTFQNNMQNGMIHKIPISLPVKVLKYFTLNSSINITDRMYAMKIRKYWSGDTLFNVNDTIVGSVVTDTIPGFNNTFDFNLSASLSTKIYGMLRFKKGPLRAIRHVFTPSIGLSYTPDFGAEKWGYYDYYYDTLGKKVEYSKYDRFIYGSPPGRKSGQAHFNFANTLEIKVPSEKDTVTGLKKIKLIENFTVSGSYDFARDSLNLSPINMSGRSRLWKNLNLQYSSRWDPYAVDSAGRNINVFEWKTNHRLLRRDNTSWYLSFNLALNDKTFNKKKQKIVEKKPPIQDKSGQLQEIKENPNEYIQWSIPWTLNLDYSFRYSNVLNYVDQIWTPKKTIVQTLGFSGNVNITPKWKFTFLSGWDFTNKQLSLTSISLYRDLHCWEMRFNWIPFGYHKSWNFSINVKASILQDLKITKKKDFRDY